MSHLSMIRTAVGDAVSRWATESQQAARRNAMVASTAMAARRKELDDVEDFLATRDPLPEGPEQPAHEVRRSN